MINKDIREYLATLDPNMMVFDDPSYDNSIVGVDDDYNHVIYDMDKMVEELAKDDDISLEEALEFVEYNTLRALPYMGAYHPIVMYTLEDMLEEYKACKH